LREFGKLVLNKNPENFHRDVEQAAFSPGSLVPGIEDSPDPLLQFRMFFYRDAQYHRIGINLHQIPGMMRHDSPCLMIALCGRETKILHIAVNCPFMATSYASLNFDGPMRTDANHAGNPDYAPNSFVDKFRPDVAEAPYQVADNTVSRKSHFYHEGSPSEYDQARVLYTRVMDDVARDHLHKNTAEALARVRFPKIQSGYLAQVHNISPKYSRSVYDLLPEQGFDFSEVEEKAKTAHMVGKEAKFRPSRESDRLVGFPPPMGIYNM
jgi:catalase